MNAIAPCRPPRSATARHRGTRPASMLRSGMVGGALLGLAACAPTANGVSRSPAPLVRLTPEQAVMNAAEVAPQGVSGLFEMTVRGSGVADAGRLYLNSQPDYRDPRNLSVVLTPAIQAQLRERFGADPAEFLDGKRIAVRGTARRVRIVFVANGRPTEKYYYQTHLVLQRASDLSVAPPPL